ncbi:hypothetical protein COZ22_01525 [bacterium (Candidatus Howlettbacteria) CG_4_10_14_3_um_filter_37_10]|nr:MAG: hypothetical protein COZ22_01525 [bacterium (Candidatus Howlettbacteria) CG_4_10_14_3_um_filter_37_10]
MAPYINFVFLLSILSTFGNTIVDEPNLKIPHPRMHERKFVLVPLMELIDKNETISQWTKKK